MDRTPSIRRAAVSARPALPMGFLFAVLLVLRAPAPAAPAGGEGAGPAELRRLDAAVAEHPDSLPPALARLRVLHRLAVDDEGLVARGESALADLRGAAAPEPALLRAYRGAFRLLRAKHAAWPLTKREHLKAGLPDLDSAVAASPDQPEIRYLRLVSCYHLPGFLGRKGSVREDFAALARLLPPAREAYPPRWYLGAAGFVLEKGDLAPADARALEAAMARAKAAGAGASP